MWRQPPRLSREGKAERFPIRSEPSTARMVLPDNLKIRELRRSHIVATAD